MMGGQELSSQDVWFAVLIFGPLTIAEARIAAARRKAAERLPPEVP